MDSRRWGGIAAVHDSEVKYVVSQVESRRRSQLAPNGVVIALLALIFALIEFLSARFAEHRLASSQAGPLAQLSVLFLFAGFWLVLFSAAHWLRVLTRRSPHRLIRGMGSAAAFLLLYVYLFLVSGSWLFFHSTDSFLTPGLLVFSLTNFGQLQLHFLQTFAQLYLILTATLAAVSYGLLLVMARARVRRPMRSRPILITFVSLAALLSSLTFLAQPAAQLLTATHPLLTYLSSTVTRVGGVDAEIDLEGLVRRDAGKVSYSAFSPQTPVIVLMIESLRRDLVEEEPSPIPFLRSLMADSYFFEKAYATASHSNYADLSVWYSQYPLRTPGIQEYERNSPWRDASIYTIFKQMGYQTAYISSQNERWGDMINWLDVPEVDFFFHSEDFDGQTWVNADDAPGLVSLIRRKIATAGKIEDSSTFGVARDWVSGLRDKQTFFLGMNLQNTHFGYVVPENAEEPFQPAKVDFPTVYSRWPRERVVDVRNRYRNALYSLDKLIEEFVLFLKQEGIWQESIFVIVGDSGEAFYEHGFGNHSGPMYDEVMRTFCLIKPPGVLAGRTVDQPISHIDLLPGVLDLLAVPKPLSFQGISPFSAARPRSIYMHTNALVHQDGIVAWPWKFLATHPPHSRTELYHLEEDPAELENRVESDQEQAARLAEELLHFRRRQLGYYSDPHYYLSYYPPGSLED